MVTDSDLLLVEIGSALAVVHASALLLRALGYIVKLRVRVRVKVKVKSKKSKPDPEVGFVMGWPTTTTHHPPPTIQLFLS